MWLTAVNCGTELEKKRKIFRLCEIKTLSRCWVTGFSGFLPIMHHSWPDGNLKENIIATFPTINVKCTE